VIEGALSSFPREADMPVERSRIRLLTGSLAFAVSLATGRPAHPGAASLPAVTVYKSPT
jgi:hypothetical protein